MSTAAYDALANPECHTPRVASTDSAGFIYGSYRAARTHIYGSYRAARTHTQGDRPSPEGSRQEVAHVSSAVGGSVSTLSFEDIPTGNRVTVLVVAGAVASETR